MTVELVGLPGVGKSTIARALEEEGYKKIKIESKAELLLGNIQYLFFYPVAFFKILFIITKVGFRYGRFYPLFMNVFLDTNARIIKGRFSKPPAIIDQGHLQGLLSLSYQQISKEDILSFRRFLPKPDYVLFLSLDEKIRQERLAGRGYGPREHEKNPHNTLWKEHLLQNTEKLRTVLDEVENKNFLSMHTNAELGDLIKKIKDNFEL